MTDPNVKEYKGSEDDLAKKADVLKTGSPFIKYRVSYNSHYMAEHVNAKVKKETAHHSADEPPAFDVDFVISRMKKVGYIDSEGYTVLPKYYDD
jgi:hypothetical protein